MFATPSKAVVCFSAVGVVVPAVAVSLLLMVAGPAVGKPAELSRYTVVDPRGDVLKDLGPGEPALRAPNRRHGDIRRTTFRHGEAAVWARMRFTALRRVEDVFNATFRLRTDAGLYRGVAVMAGSRRFFGESRWRGGMLVERRDGTPVNNCTARHRINYANDAILVRIPRGCLGNPQWIRANVIFTAFDYTGDGMSFLDGGNKSPRGITGWTPRIQR